MSRHLIQPRLSERRQAVVAAWRTVGRRRGADADHLGLLWLVILAIVMSAVSFYYYLRVLKQAYVLDAPEGAPAIKVPPVTMAALVLLAGLVILLSCAPGWLLSHL